jgi:S-(hydroxymethyl)glutathione dehydrogenase/alcohol dehydrogenase
MPLTYRAAVLHAPQTPLAVETVEAAPLGPADVLVRIKAAGLCHTDLEVIEGGLVYPMPIVLGHEAAGIVEEVGPRAKGVRKGDHVVLSWNPHCGHCFYCDRALPILCEGYLAEGPKARAFDGAAKARLADGRALGNLMFLGAFGEYCIVADQQAVPVPKALPFEEACLIGCGAVGLAAVQGARLAGAETILAADLDDAKLAVARTMGATHMVNARTGDVVDAARALSGGRGADVVLESAGSAIAFRTTVEAVRPGGEVIWLGKIDVSKDVSFRWGALMGEKRIRRSSYGGARPARDFPFLARAALAGRLDLKGLISRRIAPEDINDGFAALKAGETIRSVVVF